MVRFSSSRAKKGRSFFFKSESVFCFTIFRLFDELTNIIPELDEQIVHLFEDRGAKKCCRCNKNNITSRVVATLSSR